MVRRMDAHKRQLGQTVETYTRKRPRSQIQFTRNLQWSLPAQPRRASRSRAEDLYKTEDSCLEEDNKLEEAITALLQIGRSKPPQVQDTRHCASKAVAPSRAVTGHLREGNY